MDRPISQTPDSGDGDPESSPSKALPAFSTEDFFRNKGYPPDSVKWEGKSETLEERNARLEKQRDDDAHRHELEKQEIAHKHELEKQETAHKRELEKSETAYKRKKDGYTNTFSAAIIALITMSCLGMLINPNSPKEERGWYQSTVTIIVGGVVGYVFGKSSSSESSK